MKVTTEYDIWDEVETILWDIWYITAIGIYQKHIKYCVWLIEDKEQWLYDRQIKKKRWSVFSL